MTTVKKLPISFNYNHSKLPISRYKTFLLEKKRTKISDILEPYANIMIFKNINLGIKEKYSSYHEINMKYWERQKKEYSFSAYLSTKNPNFEKTKNEKTTKLTQPRFTIMKEIII